MFPLNNKSFIPLLIIAVIASAGLFYWWNRDLCRAFSQKDVETTCEEARNLVLQAYPGKIENIALTKGSSSERNVITQPYWLITSRLANPFFAEKLGKNVQRIVVKITANRNIDIYEVVE